MELSDYLRDPIWAAAIGGGIAAGYIHAKAQLNKEGKLQPSAYTKPAALVAILIYFIVSMGVGQRETISTEPF